MAKTHRSIFWRKTHVSAGTKNHTHVTSQTVKYPNVKQYQFSFLTSQPQAKAEVLFSFPQEAFTRSINHMSTSDK